MNPSTDFTQAQAQVLGIQDWRDNAVVGFAAITIIFLPLSFVASVFGMNTSDIRNLGQNQWVFWATAIPFTILVLSITGYFIDLPPLYWRRQERMTATTTTTPQGSLRQPDPSSQLERLLAAVHQKQATAMPAHIDTSQRLAMMKNESYLAVEEID